MKTYVWTLLLLPALVLPPSSSADGWMPLPEELALAEDCKNSGVIVSFGSYECESADPCKNTGVIVWYGSNCFATGYAGACYADECVALERN